MRIADCRRRPAGWVVGYRGVASDIRLSRWCCFGWDVRVGVRATGLVRGRRVAVGGGWRGLSRLAGRGRVVSGVLEGRSGFGLSRGGARYPAFGSGLLRTGSPRRGRERTASGLFGGCRVEGGVRDSAGGTTGVWSGVGARFGCGLTRGGRLASAGAGGVRFWVAPRRVRREGAVGGGCPGWRGGGIVLLPGGGRGGGGIAVTPVRSPGTSPLPWGGGQSIKHSERISQ